MTDLGLVLPLRIERLEEAIKVVDANGKAACYFYIAVGHERRLRQVGCRLRKALRLRGSAQGH